MTFYQELQLNQAGSKSYIASFKDPKEKWRHIGIYLFKIFLNIAFCTAFISLYSMVFGKENSTVGLAVLLCIMVFRNADFGNWAKVVQSPPSGLGFLYQCPLYYVFDGAWVSQCNYVESIYVGTCVPFVSRI